jgi:hypothetical protein
MISEEGLQNFITLYEKKYGVCLERDTAFTMMSKLLRLVQIVYFEPIKQEQNKEI